MIVNALGCFRGTRDFHSEERVSYVLSDIWCHVTLAKYIRM